MSLPKAHAADSSWNNIANAKKAIENVAPVVSNSNVDQASASYVFVPTEFIQKPLVTETQITIEVPVKKPKTVVKATSVTRKAIAPVVASNVSESAHRFPYGYCTYYVSSRRFIPWSGNAITWLSGARNSGFATGNTPQVGAIMVTSEGGSAGHVAMVDGVNGDEITLNEMNYKGFGILSQRTISASNGRILGYIY
ncbi:TPA: hypothetical protein DD449_01480 [Candidatus Berkelbacteria bacterium]|uniref:Amidase n=1 Tax=Berkelbacteria bacterium GW2011_GWE1_39_12 TaxID=1618337 RepID=A0A0G4B4N1_9BACT|nr:MAG: amidase [Berkelbacteria bacterium GW2011_GWE1_39_12]HBO60341.1 hypothetical protein [Candidatus Berkelbacteria bacterium]